MSSRMVTGSSSTRPSWRSRPSRRGLASYRPCLKSRRRPRSSRIRRSTPTRNSGYRASARLRSERKRKSRSVVAAAGGLLGGDEGGQLPLAHGVGPEETVHRVPEAAVPGAQVGQAGQVGEAGGVQLVGVVHHVVAPGGDGPGGVELLVLEGELLLPQGAAAAFPGSYRSSSSSTIRAAAKSLSLRALAEPPPGAGPAGGSPGHGLCRRADIAAGGDVALDHRGQVQVADTGEHIAVEQAVSRILVGVLVIAQVIEFILIVGAHAQGVVQNTVGNGVCRIEAQYLLGQTLGLGKLTPVIVAGGLSLLYRHLGLGQAVSLRRAAVLAVQVPPPAVCLQGLAVPPQADIGLGLLKYVVGFAAAAGGGPDGLLQHGTQVLQRLGGLALLVDLDLQIQRLLLGKVVPVVIEQVHRVLPSVGQPVVQADKVCHRGLQLLLMLQGQLIVVQRLLQAAPDQQLMGLVVVGAGISHLPDRGLPQRLRLHPGLWPGHRGGSDLVRFLSLLPALLVLPLLRYRLHPLAQRLLVLFSAVVFCLRRQRLIGAVLIGIVLIPLRRRVQSCGKGRPLLQPLGRRLQLVIADLRLVKRAAPVSSGPQPACRLSACPGGRAPPAH